MEKCGSGIRDKHPRSATFQTKYFLLITVYIVLFATLGAVLIKRWQTKCADNMEAFCAEIALLIDKLRWKSTSYSSTHRRVSNKWAVSSTYQYTTWLRERGRKGGSPCLKAFCAEIALLIDKLRCESTAESSTQRRVSNQWVISSPYHYTTWFRERGREGGCVPSPCLKAFCAEIALLIDKLRYKSASQSSTHRRV
jgi:hypothetical protein